MRMQRRIWGFFASALAVTGLVGPALAGGHDRIVVVRAENEKAIKCSECGIVTCELAEDLARLKADPEARGRVRAARNLRRVDWKCHPEVVDALAASLLSDCKAKVRTEAAESLVKMAPCLASAHYALARAAKCDGSLCTRIWAKKGVKKLANRCEGKCTVCSPGVVVGDPRAVDSDEPTLRPAQEAPAAEAPPVVEPAPVSPPPVPEALPPREASPFNRPRGEDAAIE